MISEENDTSNPPSNMHLEDLLSMALAIPDLSAINLPSTEGRRTVQVSSATLRTTEVKMDYRLTLEQRIGYLLDKKMYTDVTFIVGEGRVEFPAHKLLLAALSPVFASMFFSNMDSLSVIEIPDCSSEAFQTLLQFAYKSEAPTLRTDLASDILYAARKYNVKGLEDLCLVHMSSTITHENVFEILECTQLYDLSTLHADCWEFIEEKPKQVLRSHLNNLETDMLGIILRNDRLRIDETDLFAIVLQWSELECTRQGLDVTLDNKRMVGQNVFQEIRYTTMAPASFADKVVPTEILSVAETAKILTFMCASERFKPQVLYNTQKRVPRPTAPSSSPRGALDEIWSADDNRNAGIHNRRRHRARRHSQNL